MIEIKESKFEDCLLVSKNIRNIDIKEVKSAHGVEIQEALCTSFVRSTECYTVFKNNLQICMFGVSSGGCVWLLGTNELKCCAKEFVILGKEYISKFLDRCNLLHNYVSIDNKDSIKWLKLMGATFSDPIKYGMHQDLFLKFEIRGNV